MATARGTSTAFEPTRAGTNYIQRAHMSASFCKRLSVQSSFSIKYFKRLLIIGLVLWLLLLSVPVFSAVDVTGKTRWTIPELNMSITLPRTLVVITRDEISHSQRLVSLGYNIAQLQSWLSSNSMYLNAYSEDSSYEIVITMVENQSTRYMWDHSNYSDTKLWYEAETRLNSNINGHIINGHIVKVKNIYRTTTATYIVADLEQTRGQNKVYSQQYFTTYNGQGINITLHSYQGPLDVKFLNFHKQIIDSISFTAIKQSIIDTYGIDMSRVGQKALNGALMVFLFLGLSAAIKAIKKYVFKIPSGPPEKESETYSRSLRVEPGPADFESGPAKKDRLTKWAMPDQILPQPLQSPPKKYTPPLGLVLFLVLALIVMTLMLLSLWREKQIDQLNISSIPLPDVEVLDNEVDIRKSFLETQVATAQGNAIAQYNLGVMYSNGNGVRQDYKKALDWYSKAAAQGDVNAQYNLGGMYFNGKGVRQDTRQAKEYFGMACDAGDQGGCDEFRRLNTSQQ